MLVIVPIITGFGSALNIETLVAAAERRENAIEVVGLLCITFGVACFWLHCIMNCQYASCRQYSMSDKNKSFLFSRLHLQMFRTKFLS